MQLLNIGIFFRMKTKARKWYKRVLYHFTDLCVVNAYILNKEQSQDPLYQFKLNVALSLMYGEHFGNPMDIGEIILRQAANRQAENGDPIAEDVVDAVRLDGTNHLPESVANRGRFCKVRGCKQRSTVWCVKCRVYLCLKKERNCFMQFHTEI